MAEKELLEPLVIIEDGDLVESITEIRAPSGADVTVQSCSEEFAIKKEEEHTEEENSQQEIAGEINLEEQSLEKQQINREEDKPEITESTNDGLKGNDSKSEGQPHEVLKEKTEKPYSTEDEKATQNDPEADTKKLNSSEQQPEGGPDHKEDLKKVGIFVFSSMTSLQKEEFFDLVATAQGRRLEDQRPAPVPAPKDDLYDMILTTQAQGRLEDQRSRAPGPMDDEDFFSLLLRVQGGRMDEQRTELPRLLQT
uniref:G protein signaling modulator 1a n=1 Tax=Oreochromis aureus TaxID=47969 RepID=A0A668SGE1_OREAU